jgi:hypothetical protein
MFMLAETLGRTVEELLDGSPSHRPLSSPELVEWLAYYKLRAYEQEQEAARAKSGF